MCPNVRFWHLADIPAYVDLCLLSGVKRTFTTAVQLKTPYSITPAIWKFTVPRRNRLNSVFTGGPYVLKESAGSAARYTDCASAFCLAAETVVVGRPPRIPERPVFPDDLEFPGDLCVDLGQPFGDSRGAGRNHFTLGAGPAATAGESVLCG
jgi:hypothetical protein